MKEFYKFTFRQLYPELKAKEYDLYEHGWGEMGIDAALNGHQNSSPVKEVLKPTTEVPAQDATIE